MLDTDASIASVDSILSTTKHEPRVANPETKSWEKAQAKWFLFSDPHWQTHL